MIYSNDEVKEEKTEEPVILKETAKIDIPQKKEEKTFFPPCPDPNSNLRVGSFANEKSLERVKEFKYNEVKDRVPNHMGRCGLRFFLDARTIIGYKHSHNSLYSGDLTCDNKRNQRVDKKYYKEDYFFSEEKE